MGDGNLSGQEEEAADITGMSLGPITLSQRRTSPNLTWLIPQANQSEIMRSFWTMMLDALVFQYFLQKGI